MTYKKLRKNAEINSMIKKGNENLGELGFTDHSEIHCSMVAEQAARILKKLGYSKKQVELAKIAAYMHDIGNVVNRINHAEYGAILANEILKKTDMSTEAALILADKTDVRRDRVREKPRDEFDIHDTVNYAVTQSKLKINLEKKVIALNLQLDTNICTMYEYLDIFLGRMMMCKKAAEILGVTFKLTANGAKVL